MGFPFGEVCEHSEWHAFLMAAQYLQQEKKADEMEGV